MPRKFKVAFAIPPVNDLDVFTNDLGLIAIVENDQLVGYNVAIGGGMSRSHGNEATYPRLADVIGFVPADKVVEVTKVVLIDPSRFRRPHRPQTCAPQICHCRTGHGLGAGRN